MSQADEFCPISDSLLGVLYRATPEGVAALIKTVPAQTRAMLAIYCYRRAHLAGIALTIAATCSEQELTWIGGIAGADLFAKAILETQPLLPPMKSKKGVTLASGRLWNPPALKN